MKFHIYLSIALLILATTTQGFLLKAAIKKKLPLLVSALKGQRHTSTSAQSSEGSTGILSGLSEETNNESFQTSPLSEVIPPSVTLYQYPIQNQVIYRSIRPVVRRTVYVQQPSTYTDNILDRSITDIFNPISGVLRTAKSAIRGFLGPSATGTLASPITPSELEAPTYYSDDRGLPGFINNIIPEPIRQLKSRLGNLIRPPVRAQLESSVSTSIPAPQVYYLY